ncbi:MAG: hypothetical protein P1S46_04160 [bacterium]|nr:hypothetical protein [bacterium]
MRRTTGMRTGKNKTLALLFMALAVAFAAAAPQVASAALTAPNWLPGQPMLAGNQIIAMWLPVPGGVKYIVYMDGQKVAESPANQYMGLAPEAAGEHVYEVTAVDASGAESPRSARGVIKIVTLEPPTGVMLRPNAQDKRIGVRWTPSPGSVISNVYRSESAEGPWTLLSSVQGTDNFKDADIEFGKDYWYAVTGKDITGKETARSAAEKTMLKEPEKAAEVIKIDMVAVPSAEVEQVRFLGRNSTTDAWGLAVGSEGDLWLATGEKGTIVHLSPPPEFEVLTTIPLSRFNAEHNLKLKNADRINIYEDENLILLVDAFSSTLLALDLDGQFRWAFKPTLPPDDRDDIWSLLQQRIKKVRLIPNAAFVSSSGLVLVSENRAPIFYEVDLETGELLDWRGGYVRDGEHMDTIGAGIMMEIEPGLAWAGEPLVHRIVAFDPETMDVKYVIGEEGTHDGFIGGFLGVSDFLKNPVDGSILVADSGVGSIQAFDPKKGKYLYHIGGTPLAPDPELGGERPKLDVGAISRIFFTPDGRLWAKHGFEKYFSVRTVQWDKKTTFKKD